MLIWVAAKCKKFEVSTVCKIPKVPEKNAVENGLCRKFLNIPGISKSVIRKYFIEIRAKKQQKRFHYRNPRSDIFINKVENGA